MRIKNSYRLVLIGLIAGLGQVDRADDQAASAAAGTSVTAGTQAAPSEDEREIRKTAEIFEAAYRSKNAKGIAAQYTPNGEIVDTEGNAVRGRETIAEEFRKVFEERPEGRISVAVSSIRFVAPGVAIEDGTTSLTRARNEPPVHSRYTTVHVKVDGQWLIASTRDLAPNTEAIPISERLKPLQFLIGDWVDEADESIVATSYRWGENRKFLLHDFAVKRAGSPLLKGTQRIGWDPLRHTIMSWTFDSAGGHGQGVWTWDRDHWIIKLTGVGGAGVASSATALLTPLGKDSYRWESTNRVVGGDVSPDITITVVRRPPEPGESNDGPRASPNRGRLPAAPQPDRESRPKEARP